MLVLISTLGIGYGELVRIQRHTPHSVNYGEMGTKGFGVSNFMIVYSVYYLGYKLYIVRERWKHSRFCIWVIHMNVNNHFVNRLYI